MKIWQIFVPGLLGLALAGCRSDPEIAYLQRDNLNKQRKIDRLQNQVDDLKEALNTAAPATRRRGHAAGRDPPEPARWKVAARPGQHPPLLRLSLRRNEPTPSPTLPDRVISRPDRNRPGRGTHEAGAVLPPADRRNGAQPAVNPSSPAGGHGCPGDSALPDNSPVAQITLHPALTGGIGTAADLATRGCWWLSSPATSAATSSMCPAISAWPCSTRP